MAAKKSKKSLMMVLLLLLIVASAGGGYLYIEQQKEAAKQELITSFNKLNRGIAKASIKEIAPYVSMSFKDVGLNYRGILKTFSKKPAVHKALLQEATVDGTSGFINYKRTTTVDGKTAQLSILNEQWVSEDGKWKLVKLSAIDRAMILKARKAGKQSVDMVNADKLIEPQVDADGIKQQPIADKKDDAKKKEEQKEKDAQEDREVAKINSKLSDPLLGVYASIVPTGKDNAPYSSDGKRDPFDSLIAGFGGSDGGSGAVKATCDNGRAKEYLEGFDLMALSLAGIVGGTVKYALMEAPNGNGYTVSEGMHLGRNCGKILSIQEDKIILAEKFMVRLKGFKIRKRELKLSQEEK